MRLWPFGKRQEERASPENPSTSLANPDLWLVNWLGGGPTEAGVSINEANATTVTAVYACVARIAQAVGTLPVHVYQWSEAGAQRIEGGTLPWLLGVEPNEFQSSVDFRQTLQPHLDLWGNAYAALERNGRGDVVALLPLLPDRMTVERRAGRVRYLAGLSDGTRVEIPASEVIHLKHFGLDGLVGLSPIQQARGAVGLAKAAEDFGARFFKNDARPGVILECPGRLSDAAVARLKESWAERFSGPNQHRPAVLEEGIKLHEVGIPPQDAQFLETRRMQKEEVASIYGVPLSLLQSSEGRTYASAEQDDIQFVKYCIAPRVAVWESELNRKLFSARSGGRQYVKFNLNGLLRGAFKDRMEALVRGVQGGLFTPNEARSLEELPPMPGGDSLYLQQNMAGVAQIEAGTAGNAVGNAAVNQE